MTDLDLAAIDIGNGNLLAFFDLPGLDLGPYADPLGQMYGTTVL
jgi:hypothetical protein